METTVKQRLIDFIEFKHLTKHKFETLCGLSTGYVNNMRVSIQPDKVKSIAQKFPDLNPGWLLTGEGDMLRPPSVSQSGSGNTINQSGNASASASITDGSSDISRALDEIGRLTTALTDNLSRKDGQIQKSQEQIDRLLGIIETMNNK